MALLPPRFLDAVVAIGTRQGSKAEYGATGFLFGSFAEKLSETKSNYVLFLVTNRHVLQDEGSLVLRFNPQGTAAAREYDVALKKANGDLIWTSHANPDVDVAVVELIGPMLREEGIQFDFFRSDQQVADRKRASDEGIAEGDGVFVLGFPMGLVGEERNFVVVRGGTVARIRDALEGRSRTFLIDASVFPGNSGGPVILRPEPAHIQGTKHVDTAYLIGIVSSYLPYKDVAISMQTGLPRVIFQENSGLAAVYPIDFVLETITTALSRRQSMSGQSDSKAPP